MTTWTAFTTLADQAGAEALGDALQDLDPSPTGVGICEVEDGTGTWEVGGYFTDAPDGVSLALLAASHGAQGFVVSELPDTDWVAHVRRELRPVEAGRFFVYGAHDNDKVPEGRVALLIEASMAFGTGHHGTTLGCLRAIDRMASEGAAPARVADIGCGTAVLAMAAARVFPGAEVIASDIDDVAIDVARANLSANGLADRINTAVAAGFQNDALQGSFDLILANILKGPLIELAPEMANAVRPGGSVILSGLLNAQADEVVDRYRDVGLTLAKREDIVEWTTLTLSRNDQNSRKSQQF